MKRLTIAGFLSRFEAVNDGCWIWQGSVNSRGYGVLPWENRAARAHRVSYELMRDPVPQGLELDHLCRNRLCVNPWHLEAVTHAENLRRGRGWSHIQRSKTHCPQGHEYTESNTYHWSNGGRHCRICHKEGQQRYVQRRAAP